MKPTITFTQVVFTRVFPKESFNWVNSLKIFYVTDLVTTESNLSLGSQQNNKKGTVRSKICSESLTEWEKLIQEKTQNSVFMEDPF